MAKRAAKAEAKPKATRKAQAPASNEGANVAPGINGSNGSNGSNGRMHLHPAPNEDDIRVRAYQRYLERGAGHGADFDDWLEAEKDLKVAHN